MDDWKIMDFGRWSLVVMDDRGWPGKTGLMWTMKKRKNVFYIGHLEITNVLGIGYIFTNNEL